MRLARLALPAALAAGALLACSPKSPDAPKLPQPTILTRTTAEGATPDCPAGGVRIDAGVDDGTPGGTARDGVLDPAEIDTTVRLCGAVDALVKTTPEPPGVRCAAGGTRIDAGVDDGSGGGIPSNGLLEPGEIDRTTWVCNGLSATCIPSAGAPAVDLALAVSTPANGQAFVAGERAVLTARFLDPCGGAASLASVSRAQLFVTGPRGGAAATAAKLLNCVTDRNALDRQHHYVDLRAPHFADPAQQNLSIDPDGLVSYALAPVTTEVPGTYTAAVWAQTADGAVQLMRLVDFQVGTATPEPEGFGGAGASSTCARCHRGPGSGRLQMAHALPSFTAPGGLFGLDAAPVAGCAACHNADGYSRSPLVQKAHGVHRGVNQAAPGAAHADYGLAADPSLASYVDVHFPAEPGGEKDCAACHADDRWATAPSRLACGTCHDNVQFDAGTLVPPRVFATIPACTVDADCASLGALLTCNGSSGRCERTLHPVQADDAACAGCHSADASGSSPIRARHEIPERTRARGLALRDLTISRAGGGDTFAPGDLPVLEFTVEAAGTTVSDLSSLTLFMAAAGPLTSPQRMVGQTNLRTSGTLAPLGAGRYRWTAPASAALPLTASVAGTCRAVLWAYDSVPVSGLRETATAHVEFPFLLAAPLRGRDVVTDAACDACHRSLQYHGGTRRTVAGCGVCHTAGVEDRGLGAVGRSCVQDADCPGNASGWEQCQGLVCVAVADPTPGRSIVFADLTHRVHGARLAGGYASAAVPAPFTGKLVYLGFGNALVDFSDRLLPVDLRNCAVCHADTATACSADAQCGVGQSCLSGRCRNTSWQVPSTAACLGCHDTAAAAGHAALETWTGGGQPVETCAVCHGPSGTASVAAAHRISDPLVAPLPRGP